MIKILHTSDLHGNISKIIERHKNDDFDIWIDSGDFHPDPPDFAKRLYSKDELEYFQSSWFYEKEEEIVNWLNERPLISVPGNHDWSNLNNFIGIKAEEGPEVLGLKFSGFGEVPFCGPVFANQRDVNDFGDLIQRIDEHQPDVLITHSPPFGILDTIASRMRKTVWSDTCLMAPINLGCKALTDYIFIKPNKIKFHFFGHIHNCAGVKTHKDVMFCNGATNASIYNLPTKEK